MTKRVRNLACKSSVLAELHNSLDTAGKKALDTSLKLAEEVTRQCCAEKMCGLCGAARLGHVEKAVKDSTTRQWQHRDRGQYLPCSAGPLHE